MFEVVVGRIRENRAETDGKGEEALCHGRVPNTRLEKFRPFRSDEEQYSRRSTIQCHCSDQKAEQDDVGENCEEVGSFTRTFHTLGRNQDDGDPTDQKAKG